MELGYLGHEAFTFGHHFDYRFGRPLKRMGTFMPFCNKCQYPLRQVIFVRKIGNPQPFALQNRKPLPYLVRLVTVYWWEVKYKPQVFGQLGLYLLALMHPYIIGHYMNRRDVRDNLPIYMLQKGDEFHLPFALGWGETASTTPSRINCWASSALSHGDKERLTTSGRSEEIQLRSSRRPLMATHNGVRVFERLHSPFRYICTSKIWLFCDMCLYPYQYYYYKLIIRVQIYDVSQGQRHCPPVLQYLVVYLVPADNFPAFKTGYNAPDHTTLRGHYYDSASYLLPACSCGTPVVMRHAALRLAQPRRSITSATGRTRAPSAQAQTRQRAHTLRGPHPTSSLCCV